MGQTVAGVGFNALLGVIGYVSAEAGAGDVVQQTPEVNNGIYTLATLVPFILYIIMALLMQFGYNIKRDDAIALKNELEERNAKRDEAKSE